MKIVFVLPSVPKQFIGGYRVHYEYANRLAEKGHQVTVSHMVNVYYRYYRNVLMNAKRMFNGVKHEITWFRFHPRVKVSILPNNRCLEKCDILILTGWETAEVFGQRHDKATCVAQIVYDYEFYMSSDESTKERISQAFHKPDMLIATSKVVASMLKEVGLEYESVVTCGYDKNTFFQEQDCTCRKKIVGILLRDGETKRVNDAIEALDSIRKYSDFRVVAGGKWSRDLPEWIEQVDTTTDAKLRDFYNSLAVFILSSEYEGWGLPAVEALACGSSVVSTLNGGVEDFLINERNSLLVPIRSPSEISKAVERLLGDKELRFDLIRRGLETVRNLDWDVSVNHLEETLSKGIHSLSME